MFSQKNSPYSIPPEVLKKYPDLVELILATESMNDEEREYWFSVIPIMNAEQIAKLKAILVEEKEQMKQIDDAYAQELEALDKQHRMEWKRYDMEEKQNALEKAEKKDKAEEKKAEETLLQNIRDL